MKITFDRRYIEASQKKVVMVAANGIVGDARVIRTAETVKKLGYDITLLGCGKRDAVLEGFVFPCELVRLDKRVYSNDSLYWYGSMYRPIITKIKNLVLSGHLDVLHTHDIMGLYIGARVFEEVGDVNFKWIHDVHEFVMGLDGPKADMNEFMKEVECNYLSLPDTVYSVSDVISDRLSELYGISLPEVLFNSPRACEFQPFRVETIRSKLGLSSEVLLGVYVGNVKPERNLEVIVRALVAVPNLHCAIITNNNNEYTRHLRLLAEELGVLDRIFWHPYVPFFDVSSFISDADFGLHPISVYGNSEVALPNKLFEYLSAGLPVFCSSASRMKSFIDAHACGHYFNPSSLDSCVLNLQKMVLDVSKKKFPTSLMRSIFLKYCWDLNENKLYRMYSHSHPNGFSHATFADNDCQERKKILHLPGGNSGQPRALSTFQRKGGADSKNLLLGVDKYEYGCDINITSKYQGFSEFEESFFEEVGVFDVYHFHAASVLHQKYFNYPTLLDVFWLKLQGKKIVFHFRGTESRIPSLFAKLNAYNYIFEADYQNIARSFPEDRMRGYIRAVCGIADVTLVTDPENLCYAPQSLVAPRVVLDVLDAPIRERNCGDGRPVVVHAPSNKAIKGTEFVLAAVERLQANGFDFEFKLLEGMNNVSIRKALTEADIVIDQLRIGWYGVLAVEAMASGCAVIAYVRPDLRHFIFDEKGGPVVSAESTNLYEVLSSLLSDPVYLYEQKKRGYDFFREYHAEESARNYSIIYEKPSLPIRDVEAVLGFFDHRKSGATDTSVAAVGKARFSEATMLKLRNSSIGNILEFGKRFVRFIVFRFFVFALFFEAILMQRRLQDLIGGVEGDTTRVMRRKRAQVHTQRVLGRMVRWRVVSFLQSWLY